MKYYKAKGFLESLRKMNRAGGRAGKAATQVEALLGRIQTGDQDPFRPLRKTKHGENRIPNCTKYDLNDFTRLICVRYHNATILLYFAGHDDADKWLKSNKGCEFIVNDAKELSPIFVSPDLEGAKISSTPDNYDGKLFERLEDKEKELLLSGLEYKQLSAILDLRAGATDEQIELAVRDIPRQDHQRAAYDALVLLNSGKLEAAANGIRTFSGQYKRASELTEDDFIAITEGTEVRRIEIGSKAYGEWLENFIRSEHPFDWMLFMHPEQERYVTNDYPGPVKLSGVSGSGKTAVAIKRAIRLAKKYPGEIILLVTLNKALASLIDEIVEHACTDRDARARIEVRSYFDVAQEKISEFEPNNYRIYSDTSDKFDEHRDEIYREFYRCLNNNESANVLLPTHRMLTAQGIDAELYVSEEFDWVRSATHHQDRRSYLDIERKGRGYPLGRDHREAILAGLEAWESKMKAVGLIDSLGLTMALSKHIQSITPKYRSIIVDEAQDFGTTQLQVIRQLTAHNENDIFCCGDAAQQVQAKHQSFDIAGVDVRGRAVKLTRNYRNSREILETAYKVLIENLSDEHFDNSDLDISDPQYASRSSPDPMVLEAESLEQEIAAALELINTNISLADKEGQKSSGCIAIAGFTQFEVEEFGRTIDVDVLNAEQEFLGGKTFLSDLEQTKGHEFDTVVIVNCRSGALPPTGVPKEELFRFASQFYVSMTRAKSELFLSFSGTPSSWLTNPKVGLEIFSWNDFVDIDDCVSKGQPSYLPEFPDQEAGFDVLTLTGRQFGYTPWARGLGGDLLGRIGSKVPGQSLIRGGKRIEWRDMGQLMEDLRGRRGGGKTLALGDKSDETLSGRLLDASAGLRPMMKLKAPAAKPTESAPEATPSPISTSPTPEMPVLPQNSNHTTGSLTELSLTARQYASLFALSIKTIDDLKKVKKQTLRKIFTASEVENLRCLAFGRTYQPEKKRPVQPKPKAKGPRLSGTGLRGKAVSALTADGRIYVSDLEGISIKKLKGSIAFSALDLKTIVNLVEKHKVKIKP